MKRRLRISEAEWEVMKVIWANSQATSHDVVEYLSGKTRWKPKTVRTLINRLVRKKVLGFKREGRKYIYFPLLTQEECLRAERRSFLSRVYGGALQPMIAAFLEEEDLSPEEIQALRRILERKREEG